MPSQQSPLRLALTFFFLTLLNRVVWSQVGWEVGQEVEDVMDLVFEYTYPEYYGRCHACVFSDPIAVYIRQSPVCLFEYEGQVYNIAEDIERYTCFNDDPRAYEDIECKTTVANDTFDCIRGCSGIPSLEMGQSYDLQADRRCTYRVDLWDTSSVNKLLFENLGQSLPADATTDANGLVSYSAYGDDVFFFLTSDILERAAGQSRVNRENIFDYRVPLDSEIELTDGWYLLVINLGQTSIRFTVSGELEPPPPPEPEPIPEPTSEPAPEPAPEPTPEPTPQPDPQPTPQPVQEDNSGTAPDAITDPSTDQTDQATSSSDTQTGDEQQNQTSSATSSSSTSSEQSQTTGNHTQTQSTQDTDGTEQQVIEQEGETQTNQAANTTQSDTSSAEGQGGGSLEDQAGTDGNNKIQTPVEPETPRTESQPEQTSEASLETDSETMDQNSIEYYAGTSESTISDNERKTKKGTSEATQIILTVAVMVTVLVILITVFHMVAEKCRQADLKKKGEQIKHSEDGDMIDSYDESDANDQDSQAQSIRQCSANSDNRVHNIN